VVCWNNWRKGEKTYMMKSLYINLYAFAKLLISKGANVSYYNDEGVTVGTQSAYVGLTEVLAAIIEKGGDITSKNNEGIDPLIAAASEGHDDCVKLLLETGKVDVNAVDKDGTTALMATAVRGHHKTLQLLISHGSKVNAQNTDGHTALMFAYNGKNRVQTLMDKYKEYVKDANDNSTQIMNEALQDHLNSVKVLISNGADKSIKV
jgi:ankyrin repeat protein